MSVSITTTVSLLLKLHHYKVQFSDYGIKIQVNDKYLRRLRKVRLDKNSKAFQVTAFLGDSWEVTYLLKVCNIMENHLVQSKLKAQTHFLPYRVSIQGLLKLLLHFQSFIHVFHSVGGYNFITYSSTPCHFTPHRQYDFLWITTITI